MRAQVISYSAADAGHRSRLAVHSSPARQGQWSGANRKKVIEPALPVARLLAQMDRIAGLPAPSLKGHR